jgi:hypothetical protein
VRKRRESLSYKLFWIRRQLRLKRPELPTNRRSKRDKMQRQRISD